MMKLRKNLICLFLAFCMVLALAPCALASGEGSGSSEEPSAEPVSFETMGDVFAYESDNSGFSEDYFVYVFEADGVIYRATAELTEEVSEALWDLDFFDENYEANQLELVAPLPVANLENLSEMIPAQEELDALVGKTGQELLDDGWSIWGWDLDSMTFWLYHGPFSFTALFEGELELDEDYGFDEESDFGPLVLTSLTYDGLGDATADVLDQMMDEEWDVDWDEEWEEWDEEWIEEGDVDEGAAFYYGESDIDYLALVNKQNPLPEGWEEALETVTVTNSVGDDVVVEAKAYGAYEQLREDLEANNAIYLELDSAYRSVEEQQDIMDRFIEKYGEDYAAKTVAQPGYSEHQTGIALDLYFRIENDYGEFIDVYYNEDMEKEEYKEIWDEIHAKLADYGFILRYLEGEEHITGYRYEPWHIRYVDSVEIAQEIMSQPGLTLEEYLAGESAPEVEIDLSGSELYTEDELYDAMLAIKCSFAAWEGCELHNIRYAGDEANNEENLEWLNTLNENGGFTQVAEFLTDFHSPVEAYGAWAEDTEYTDYQWWLARAEDGDWELVSMGY